MAVPVVIVLYVVHCDCTVDGGTLDVAYVACDALDDCTCPGNRHGDGERADACRDGPLAAASVASPVAAVVVGESPVDGPGDGQGDHRAVAPGDRGVVVAAAVAAAAPLAIGAARLV